MTLDEAIKHAEEVVEKHTKYNRYGGFESCDECGEEHRQLAEWLSELKVYKERIPSYEAGYNDAKREIALSGEYERCYERGKADAQTERWIPCSERLPNDRDWYLGIFKEPDTGWINPLPFICDYVGSETKATTKEHWILRGFTDRDERIDYYFNLECVAWMPLPNHTKRKARNKYGCNEIDTHETYT